MIDHAERLYSERITMLNSQRFSTFLILLSIVFCTVNTKTWASDFSDEKRLSGFEEQQKRNREFDQDRLSDIDEIKRKRAEWEKLRQKGIQEYKDEKREQTSELSERNTFYKENAKKIKEEDAEFEKARLAYVKERNEARKRVGKLAVSEEREYGLDQPFIRSEKNGRKNLNAITGSSGGGGGGYIPPAYNPPADFPNPDFDSAQAPVNMGAPEFFEPENIPPPPPPMDTFDDPIPPPIFEDPDM